MIEDVDNIFSPDFQKKFWAELDPDLRFFLDEHEKKEDWTYKYNEIPSAFIELSSALPRVAVLPPSDNTKQILHQLIPILSSLPMRESLTSIMWLDRSIKNEGDMGWGVVLYMESAQIYHNNKDSDIFLQSKVIYERIRTLVQSSLSLEIFSNTMKK